MPNRFLMVTVDLYYPRWHGAGDWPPSPMRLHQALLAGICLGRGSELDPAESSALTWLEEKGPPRILVPLAKPGRRFTMYVPNNDLDSVGGDRARIGEIREGKQMRPWLLASPARLGFCWGLGEQEDPPYEALRSAAQRLYQFGRGVDPAFADATILNQSEMDGLSLSWPGQIWPPSPTGQLTLPCPTAGSLTSLLQRHEQFRHRLRSGRLEQPAPAKSVRTGYGRDQELFLCELREKGISGGFAPWPLRKSHALVTAVRDALAAKLIAALPEKEALINQVVVGRGAGERDKLARVQMIPLPSIGAEHTDPSIRRLLLRFPTGCPLEFADLAWALTGLEVAEGGCELVPAEDMRMLSHYGIGDDNFSVSQTWQTVTPMAIARVRPPRGQQDGLARNELLTGLRQAVRQAVRHAGVPADVDEIELQREPWQPRGVRAEEFAATDRFHGANLWHVRLRFRNPLSGPLVLGDGRYLGLGVFAPAQPDALIFPIPSRYRPETAKRQLVLESLRRALMSLAARPDGSIATLFSGHDREEGPAASGQHRHVYLLARDADHDLLLDELMVLAPWTVDRSYQPDFATRSEFARVVPKLAEIRAGAAGVLMLATPRPVPVADPVLGLSTTWTSASPYVPTRNSRHPKDRETVAAEDLIVECKRRGLPPPHVTIHSLRVGSRGGAQVWAELQFKEAVAGPILLGRSAHCGGGLFLPM